MQCSIGDARVVHLASSEWKEGVCIFERSTVLALLDVCEEWVDHIRSSIACSGDETWTTLVVCIQETAPGLVDATSHIIFIPSLEYHHTRNWGAAAHAPALEHDVTFAHRCESLHGDALVATLMNAIVRQRQIVACDFWSKQRLHGELRRAFEPLIKASVARLIEVHIAQQNQRVSRSCCSVT